MGFKHEGGYDAVRIRAENLSGAPAVDGYLLRFSVSFSLTAWQSRFGPNPSEFRDIRARLMLGENRVHLGSPTTENPVILEFHEFEQTRPVIFDLMVPASTIEKIEEERKGRGIDLTMRISSERVGEQRLAEAEDVHFRINQSHWIDVMKQMKYGSHLLCELPVEVGCNGELREVWKSMNLARDLLYTGHYNSAVMECRKALETAVARFELGDQIQAAGKRFRGDRCERISMSKRERLWNLINATTHATQLGGHPDSENEIVDYSRQEALLIFSVVAAGIAHMGRR